MQSAKDSTLDIVLQTLDPFPFVRFYGIIISMKNNKQKQPTTMKENTGKVLIDLGKLMFGSFILGGVLRGEVPQFVILISGFVGAITFIAFGLVLTNKNKEKE